MTKERNGFFQRGIISVNREVQLSGQETLFSTHNCHMHQNR
jgi:hypothetical protein